MNKAMKMMKDFIADESGATSLELIWRQKSQQLSAKTSEFLLFYA